MKTLTFAAIFSLALASAAIAGSTFPNGTDSDGPGCRGDIKPVSCVLGPNGGGSDGGSDGGTGGDSGQ